MRMFPRTMTWGATIVSDSIHISLCINEHRGSVNIQGEMKR
jgi:hypothetical protein